MRWTRRTTSAATTPNTTTSAMHTSPVCLVIRGWGPDGTPEPKVLLSWGSQGVRSPCWSESDEPFLQAGYRVVQGLQLSSGGQGSSRALSWCCCGTWPIRRAWLAGCRGVLATPRVSAPDRGRVLAGLACTIAPSLTGTAAPIELFTEGVRPALDELAGARNQRSRRVITAALLLAAR